MPSTGHPTSSSPRWRKIFGSVAVFALFAGMLFWTKLRLVSDIPRSAYAEPPVEVDADPQIASPGDQEVEPVVEPDSDQGSDDEHEDSGLLPDG